MKSSQAYDLLIAEDDRDIRFYLNLYLTEMGFRCLVAENGLEALLILERLTPAEVPAICLLDVNMPVLDGLGLVKVLQQRSLATKMEVIFASAVLVAPEISYHGKRCLVLSKPLDLDQLVVLLNDRLDQGNPQLQV